ncbi:MAG: 5'-methylthioadenosine/S-adenosylhomocysteine nucleosidase [Boseongicola sp.]|nr:5'-methylthioadenosine/S-adenosylhomocysteine nucleosidase [Boseongicola sp.]
MTFLAFAPRVARTLCAGLTAAMLLMASAPVLAETQDFRDGTPRIAVVSAFAPELEILKGELRDRSERSVNGVNFTTGTLEGRRVVLFLSGISVVNAAMTAQLALDRFAIERIMFSGIAGGVDPSLGIGDVAVPERWGQYLEMLFAREVDGGWATLPFFEYPYGNFGMMFPRSVTVSRAGADGPETRFWFPVDETLLEAARNAASKVTLARCTSDGRCLDRLPRIAVGGSGVSGGAFVDNADFRTWVFETFGARLLDMESAAVAHVAHANGVPFVAVRSLADLAGGGAGANQMETFLELAAGNAAAVDRAMLSEMPDRP